MEEDIFYEHRVMPSPPHQSQIFKGEPRDVNNSVDVEGSQGEIPTKEIDFSISIELYNFKL